MNEGESSVPDVMRDNMEFRWEFEDALQEATASLSHLRVLDYGAGARPSPDDSFSRIQPDQQQTVYYDPQMNPDLRSFLPGTQKDQWTNELPQGKFDLIICDFSLHHMDEPPIAIFNKLQERYDPNVLAIAEYDYSRATPEDFSRTFVDAAEKKELGTLFDGDEKACFDIHSKLKKGDVQNALEQNGFSLVKGGNGKNKAENKFFLIVTK